MSNSSYILRCTSMLFLGYGAGGNKPMPPESEWDGIIKKFSDAFHKAYQEEACPTCGRGPFD